MALVALVAGACSLEGDEEVSRSPAGDDIALTDTRAGEIGTTKAVADGTGSISFEVPEVWSSTEEGASDDWAASLLASTDTAAVQDGSWKIPGVWVVLSPILAERVPAPDVTTLSALMDGIVPREPLERECNDRRSSTITPSGSDALSLSVGKYFDFGVADAWTGCGGGDAALTDLVAVDTQERVVVYMQLITSAPEDKGAIDHALQTLSLDFAKLPGGTAGEGGPEPTDAVEKQEVTGPLDDDALRQLVPVTLGGTSRDSLISDHRDPALPVVATFYDVPERAVVLRLIALPSAEDALRAMSEFAPEGILYGSDPGFTQAREGRVTAGEKDVGRWRLFHTPGDAEHWPAAQVVWTNGPLVVILLDVDESAQGIGEQALLDEALGLFRETPF